MAKDFFSSSKSGEAQYFVYDRYVETIFPGIMPDTGDTKVSTARKSQFKALQCEMPKIELGTTRANKALYALEVECP